MPLYRRNRYRIAGFLLVVVTSVGPLSAQTAPRYALVIGNAAYQGMSALRNPANDAEDVAAALRGLGFSVDLLKDAGKRAMETALVAFRQRLSGDPATEGVFYYAGHGVQSDGANYLVPVDAVIPAEEMLPYEAVNAGLVLDMMKGAGNAVNLVILDACRDNPFAWSRSANRGLSVVGRQPTGSIVVYATAAGAGAADGAGRNGLFTAGLLKHVATPGIDIMEMLKRTGAEVQRLSGGAQNPAVYSQFFGNWQLAPAAPAAAPVAPGVSFGPLVAAVGDLSVTLASPGRLTVSGVSVDLAAGTLPVNNLPVGGTPVLVAYPDGKTEQVTVYVEAGKTAAVRFGYAPSAPAPAPAPAADEPTTPGASAVVSAAPTVAAAAPAVVVADPARAIRGEVYVAGGSFQMGDEQGEYYNCIPVHRVSVASFWIMATELTQKDYAAVGGENHGWYRGDRLPAVGVSWNEAVAYANRLSVRDGLKPAYTISGAAVSCDWSAGGWRLPTEAEWEYAARGGAKSRGFPFSGGNVGAEVGWHKETAGDRPHDVGGKPPNELGLFDMSGNAFELCWDWYSDYTASAQSNPRGPASGKNRVKRGGSWLNELNYGRSGLRFNGGAPDTQAEDDGFRLVRSAAR